MVAVKIKFRRSPVSGREGTVYYQVSHRCTVRQIDTPYKLFPTEWDKRQSVIVATSSDENRRRYLSMLDKKIAEDMERLEHIIATLKQDKRLFTADDVASVFSSGGRCCAFYVFMQAVIAELKQLGKVRTCETYHSALNSFMRFLDGREILLDDMNSELMISYEAWLESKDISRNTISFYMRILRATYNRAVEKGMTAQRFPFKHVYTGVEKTMKRALPLGVIKQLSMLDLSHKPVRSRARDMLLFSFYTRGMSLIDMAFLRKKDLNNGVLSYRRKKTGRLLFIKWEPCMQEIVERYSTSDSPYLLPIISKPGVEERKQYINESHCINRHLKALGKELGLSVPLTHYVARHSWASATQSRNIPIAIISEGMGHDSEATTRIYLTSLDSAVIDKANSLILKSLQGM